jgi:magnesium transporter
MAKVHRKRRTYREIRRVTLPGAPPGTIAVRPDAHATTVTAMGYGPKGFVEQKIEDLDELQSFIADWPVTWVNVIGLGDAETIERIGKLFGLHRLALEDVVNVHQRPKVEHYGDSIYVVLRMPSTSDHLISEQFSIFLGKTFVVSFDERPGDCLEPVRQRIRHGRGKTRECGADYLAYTIIDAIVDAYFPLVEDFGERLEVLEDAAISGIEADTPQKLLAARHDLLMFRRAVWPLRDTLSSMYRDETHLVGDETRVYLRDCYDHALQVLDVIETYREIANGLMELYMSGVSNRMNEIMKVLTMMATVFIPLTFVAGLYGMNFHTERSPWNMPELDWYYGYPLSLAVMALITLVLVYYFHRKGWFRSSPHRYHVTRG